MSEPRDIDIHRLVVEHAFDLVTVVDRERRIVYASPSHERVLGLAPADLIGTDPLDVVHPDDREGAAPGSGAVPRIRLRHRDGRVVYVEGHVTPVREAGLRVVVLYDVTARTRAERRRDAQYAVTRVLSAARSVPQAAAEVLRVVCEHLDWEVGLLWRADGDVLRRVAVHGEPAGAGVTLRRGERLPGRVWRDGEPAWGPDVPAAGLHSAIAVPVGAWGVLEFAGRKARGPDADRLRVFASFGGQLGQFIQRSRAEAMLAAVVDGTQDAVFVKDRDGRYLLINEAGARALGRPVDQVVGRDDRELMPADAAADIMGRDRVALEQGETVVAEEAVGTRLFQATKAPYRDTGGDVLGLIGIAHDVTEHRRLEAELQQAQKMEAMGRLAGGVAHDFNNILSVIRGFSDLARQRLGDQEATVQEWLEQVSRATDQGTALTRQLLSFSARRALETEVLELNAVVAEMDALLRRVIGEDLRLVTVFGASPGRVELNRSQLEQVVMNLAVNARDAMPHGGKLTIETAEVPLDGEAAEGLGLAPGQYVVLRISDTGTGMDAATRARIFEPFFTTKSAGRGTGLGLSTVYGIVTQSGGHIGVQSVPGAGSTFVIHLPAAAAASGQANAAPPAQGGAAPTGTLLVAEDDDVLRSLIRAMLEQGGYHVLTARSGEEALSAAAAAGGIDALVTDVVMPGMRGPDLAARLRAQHPDLRVVFVTGYGGPFEQEVRPGDALLTKPFGMQALLAALGETRPERRSAP